MEATIMDALRCPACNIAVTSLDKLNLHLSFSCPSLKEANDLSHRTSSKRLKAAEPKDAIALEEDDDDSGVSFPKSDSGAMILGSVPNEEQFPAKIEDTLATRTAQKMVSCPGCSMKVPMDGLDFHLEKGCSSRSNAFRIVKLDEDTFQRKPPGLVLLTNFISEDEEARLVECLEQTPWKPARRNGSHEMKHYGIRVDYSAAKPRTRYPDKEEGEEDLPEFLQFVIKRFEQYPPLGAWWPNEANANRYIKDKGHNLTAHFDDRRLSGEIICNVSLMSDCVMTFRRPGSAAEPFRVHIPRRSASVMSRSARYDFTHEIANEDFLGPKRYSLNFRQASVPLG